MVEDWSSGTMEDWSSCVLERQSKGILLEQRSIGGLQRACPSFNIPMFRHSTIPPLQLLTSDLRPLTAVPDRAVPNRKSAIESAINRKSTEGTGHVCTRRGVWQFFPAVSAGMP